MKTYFLDVIFEHYVDFGGRATRTQFWLFVLFNFLIGMILSIFGKSGQTISYLYQLAVLLPSLAIAARRLRDGGVSPWWLLIGLIPVIGWIVLLVMYLLPSK